MLSFLAAACAATLLVSFLVIASLVMKGMETSESESENCELVRPSAPYRQTAMPRSDHWRTMIAGPSTV